MAKRLIRGIRDLEKERTGKGAADKSPLTVYYHPGIKFLDGRTLKILEAVDLDCLEWYEKVSKTVLKGNWKPSRGPRTPSPLADDADLCPLTT
jgi:hypothetical protein